jgi:hypothetical protein
MVHGSQAGAQPLRRILHGELIAVKSVEPSEEHEVQRRSVKGEATASHARSRGRPPL